ncbi:unnamed protein product, partial [Prorocentrum cordatum]
MAELFSAALDNDILKEFQHQGDHDNLNSWIAAVGNLDGQRVDSLQALTETCERYKARAVEIGLSNGRRAFASWVSRIWKQSPGLALRHVKPTTQPRPEHFDQQGKTYAMPHVVMDKRANYWEGEWAASGVNPERILEGLNYVEARAREEDAEPIELEALGIVLARQSPRKSRGADNPGPIE